MKNLIVSLIHWWAATKENVECFFILKGVQKTRPGQRELCQLEIDLQHFLLALSNRADVRVELREMKSCQALFFESESSKILI